MSSPARVDVCIVNYFSAADVRRSIQALDDWGDGRLWLVDNSVDAHEEQALRKVAAQRPRVELLVPGENLGFGRGCNLAFERSDAEFFLLLNPDALIGAQDLQRLVAAMQADPRLGAVSPRIFWNLARSFLLPAAFPQSPLATLGLSLASRNGTITRLAAQGYLRRQRDRMCGDATFGVDFLAGAVMLLRRSAVQQAGGLFDPAYFMFYEDSDLSLRLRRAGHLLAMVPSASAVHEYRHKASKGPLMAQARDVYFRKQFARFHALTRGLRRVDALARPVPLARWFEVLPRPLANAGEFREQTNHAGVIAFSPSPLMMPAIFRPRGAASASFSDADWELLEPGGYAALLACANGTPKRIFFEKA